MKFSDEDKNWKLEFEFGDEADPAETGELVDFGAMRAAGALPQVRRAGVRVRQELCVRKVGAHCRPATPSCDFKSGQIILQQPVERAQMEKLLATGKTDLLDKFVSMRTRRAFKAFLAWDAEAGKVNFEFEPRASKFPPRKTAAGAPRAPRLARWQPTRQAPAKKAAAGKAAAKKAPGQEGRQAKAPRARPPRASTSSSPAPHWPPSSGPKPVARTAGDEEAVGLHQGPRPAGRDQQARDQRRRQVAGRCSAKPQVTMFELAGIVGKHLG
jgi:DNA topoisomerase III